jgi:hypothetical protein
MAPQVPRRTIAEMATEFDELAFALSKDPRDQLTTGIGLFYTFSTTMNKHMGFVFLPM